MTLTNHQLKAFDRIHLDDDQIITLRGFAGTGKTHTAVDIIKSYLDKNDHVCVAAPTATALGVVKSKLKEASSLNDKITFKTVSSLLKMPMEQVRIGDMLSYHLNEKGVSQLKTLLSNVNAPNQNKVIIDTYKYIKEFDEETGLYKPKKVKAYSINKEELVKAFKNSSLSKGLKVSDIDTSPDFILLKPSEVQETLSDFKLVIIDEMPMVNSEETKLIEQAQELAIKEGSHFPRIVFVGDAAQLRPVQGSINPYMISKPDNENVFELTDILRSTDEIAHLGEKVNSGVKMPQLAREFKDNIHILNKNIDDLLIDNLDELAVKDVLLTFTNKVVDKLNKAMRLQRGYTNETPIQKNEPIMVGVNARSGNDIIFANGEEFNVESVYEPSQALYAMKEGYEFREARNLINFDDSDFSDALSFVASGRIRLVKLKSNSIEDQPRLAWVSGDLKYTHQGFLFEQALKRLEEIAAFNNDEIPVINASFGYARTIHKSQGSEWPNVGVIMTEYELRRQPLPNLQYTAVTRAKENLDVFILK